MCLLGGYRLGDISYAGTMRIDAREEHCPARGATGGSVEVCKRDTSFGQRIDGRSGNFAAVDADIRKSQVVRENQDDIGSVVRFGASGGTREAEK